MKSVRKISNTIFEALFNMSIEGMLLMNSKGEIILANPHIESLFGYTNEELVGNKIEMLLPPENRSGHINKRKAKTKASGRRQMGGGKSYFGYTKDNIKFPVEIGLSKIEHEGESIMLCLITDITKSTHAVEEITLMNEALIESVDEINKEKERSENYAQYQTLINSLLSDATSDMELEAFLDKAIELTISASFTRLLPKGGIFLTENENELKLIRSKNLGEALVKKCGKLAFGTCLCGRAALRKKTVFASCINHEHEIMFPNMEEHGHYNVPIMGNGKVLGVIVVYLPAHHDKNQVEIEFLEGMAHAISLALQRKAYEEELKENILIAQKANHAKGLFLGTMTHEIRTPLNAIVGISNLLKDVADPKDRVKLSDTLCRSANNLTVLINDILDYSKFEEGKVELNIETFDFHQLIEDAIETYSSVAKEKGIALNFEIDPKIPQFLLGDKHRLNQVLLNLFSNAIKFTTRGEVRLEAKRTSTDPSNCELELSVIDTGMGMKPESVKRIFEEYAQADSSISGNYGGTGLGLSICKKILQLFGGEIKVESEWGKGTRFYFPLSLPITGADSDDIKTEDYQKIRGKRILAAEDNEINIMVLKMFLEKWGVDFDFVKDGVEVLKKVGEEDYDLLLVDYHMPKMDGAEAIARIRQGEIMGKENVPVIALTADGTSMENASMIKLKLSSIQSKPFNPDELYQDIVDAISKND